MVDRDIVQSKIQTVKRCVDRVGSSVPKDVAGLIADITAQDVVSVNLQRAVQACVDLAVHVIADRGLRVPEGMAEAFALLHERKLISDPVLTSMRAAAGFRNISVHEYRKIDWNIVYGICTNHLDDFRKYIEELEKNGAISL